MSDVAHNFKVIQHRANDCLTEMVDTPYAEVDVHLTDNGKWVVKHDVVEPYPTYLTHYLQMAAFDSYFVNIKQALGVDDLQNLQRIFGERLIGFFDVPMPLAFYATEAKLPIYHRRSEFEDAYQERIWLDPLESQTVATFSSIELRGLLETNTIVCSPELHGKTLEDAQLVWKWMKQQRKTYRFEGLVTKYPREARKFFEC